MTHRLITVQTDPATGQPRCVYPVERPT